MKKIFQVIGLISLTCFSFFVTEKTAMVVNEMDEIMIDIKAKKDEYKSNPIDALIDGDNIIPGINGRVVNVNKSYKNMKKNGYYNDKLYVYDYIKPKVNLVDNIDKFIIKGNPDKRMVSLIFLLSAGDDATTILDIVNNYNIKVTFFVDYNWFVDNTALVQSMIKKGHTVAPFIDNYNDSNFEWMDMVIKNINKQSNGFCYDINNNKDNLNACKLRNNYTIKPISISENSPLMDIKEKLEPGSLLSLKINSKLKKELSTIIIYIKSKGFDLTNLEENVLE